jgi:hypothetical protein
MKRNPMRINAVILILLLFSVDLNAKENSILLEGHIGEFPIVLIISQRQDIWFGSYFYKSFKKDIEFTGKTVKNELLLSATKWDSKSQGQKTIETLHLKWGTDSSLAGRWLNNRKKELSVSLQKLKIDEVQNPFENFPEVKRMKVEEPYSYVRTSFIRLDRDSIVIKGKYTFEYLKADHSNIYFPVLLDGSAHVDKVRNIMLQYLVTTANSYYSCSYFNYRLVENYTHGNLISIRFNTDYYCGGAYPDNCINVININTQTGRELQLEDVLYLHKGSRPKYATDEWNDYRVQIFEPLLMKLLCKLYPLQMKSDDNADCDYSREYTWAFSQWYMNHRGLNICPNFPHVAAVCREPQWCIIPYSELKKFRNPHVKLNLP